MAAEIHIVTYHAFDRSGGVLSIRPDLFRSQLTAWQARGARFLKTTEAQRALLGEEPLPDGRLNILLTFDDGLESVYTEGLPILRELRVPACVFICTALMGADNAWPGQPAWVPKMKIMTWDQAREMAAAGIEFGSHLLDHPDLSTLSEVEARTQLSESRRAIEAQLGSAADILAFPYGRSTPQARAWAEDTYAMAFGTRMGVARAGEASMDLPRLDAYYLQPRWVYTNLGRAPANVYLGARRTLRALRGH